MGKYGKVYQKGVREDWPWTIHPVWRGIGFILILLIPFLGYQAGRLLVDANWKHGWVPVPASLVGPPGNPNLYLNLIAALLCSLVMYAVLAWFYLILWDLFGRPSRLRTPLDVPPPRRPRTLDVGGLLQALTVLLGIVGGVVAVQRNWQAKWVPVPRELLIPGPFPTLLVYVAGALFGLLAMLLLMAFLMTLYDIFIAPAQRRRQTEEDRVLRQSKFRRK